MNDLDRATLNLREALSLFGELGDVLGRAHALRKLGGVGLGTGDYTEDFPHVVGGLEPLARLVTGAPRPTR